MEPSADLLGVVLVTAPDRETALRLARTVVERRLAACVSLVPGVTSVYRWEGRIHEDDEVLLVAKAPPERLAALEATLRELHPYEVPEILALPTRAAHGPYLAWARDETAPPPEDP